MMRLRSIFLDDVSSESASDLRARLEGELLEKSCDEARAVGIARAGRVGDLGDGDRVHFVFHFLRDDPRSFFSICDDDSRSVIEKLRYVPSRFDRYEAEFVIVCKKYRGSAQTFAQIDGGKLGNGLHRLVHERDLVRPVLLRKRFHISNA